ncbi:hypothetical protein ABZ208_12615 [Streptomyces sp. NPDC006208]|uniref:LexA family protein n=1 Tax=Streptomyces sp. NPDC006208 TaxID=3156734 RepID=UPI0033A3AB5C
MTTIVEGARRSGQQIAVQFRMPQWLPAHGLRRPVSEALTDRQARILRCVGAWIAEYGEWPTIREIGWQVGLSSTSSVAYQLERLEQPGAISRSGRRWRLGGQLDHPGGRAPGQCRVPRQETGTDRLCQLSSQSRTRGVGMESLLPFTISVA